MKKLFLTVLLILGLAVNGFALQSGTATVTTAGTAVQLSSTEAALVSDIIVTAAETNAGYVYIGGSNVDASGHIGNAIAPGGHFVIPSDRLTRVWVDALNNGDDVGYSFR